MPHFPPPLQVSRSVFAALLVFSLTTWFALGYWVFLCFRHGGIENGILSLIALILFFILASIRSQISSFDIAVVDYTYHENIDPEGKNDETHQECSQVDDQRPQDAD